MRADRVWLHNGGSPGSTLLVDPAVLITAVRLPLGLAGVGAVVAGAPRAALALFGLFAVIDLFDGVIARKLGTETGFRRILDVVVDRIVIALALIALAAEGYCAVWWVAVIVARDVAQGMVSGSFTVRHQSVLVGPHWHMSYGLSVLALVSAVVLTPTLATSAFLLSTGVATACLFDFVRRIAQIERTSGVGAVAANVVE